MQKKALAVAVSGVLATPMAADAVDITMSGQINRAIQFLSDGEGTGFQFVDNSASGNRFRIRGSQELGTGFGGGITAGVYGEWQANNNPSTTATVKGDGSQTGSRGDTGFRTRQANIWFSNNWGKVTLGQTSGAGDGGAEADLSGAWIVSGVARTTYGGGVTWRGNNGQVVTEGGLLFEPGTAPRIRSRLRSASTRTISRFCTVRRTLPICPDIFLPLKTRPGV